MWVARHNAGDHFGRIAIDTSDLTDKYFSLTSYASRHDSIETKTGDNGIQRVFRFGNDGTGIFIISSDNTMSAVPMGISILT